MTNTRETVTGGPFEYCHALLEDGLQRALSVSLYESPGDILFLATALIIELVNEKFNTKGGKESDALHFNANVTEKEGRKLCHWGTGSSGGMNEVRQDYHTAGIDRKFDDDRNEQKVWYTTDSGHAWFQLQMSLNNNAVLHACVSTHDRGCKNIQNQLDVSALAEVIIGNWETLAIEMGSELFIGHTREVDTGPIGDVDNSVAHSLQRTLTSRLREGLQRLEEELPHKLRVTYASNDESIPSQLYFMRRCCTLDEKTGASHEGSMCEEDGLAYLLAHEDLRVLSHWVDEGTEALLERLESSVRRLGYMTRNSSHDDNGQQETRDIVERFLGEIARQDKETCLSFLRNIYEQPLHLEQNMLGIGRLPAERAMHKGTPAISWHQNHDSLYSNRRRSERDIQVAVIENALWEAQPSSHIEQGQRNVIFWPIYVLGKPLLVIHFSFSGDNPIFSDDGSSFQTFRELIRSLFRISEAAWNLFFDLYCDLFVESFANLYLDYAKRHLGKPMSGQRQISLEEMVARLNLVAQLLGRFINIHVASWEEVSVANQNKGESLWLLQNKLEAIEEGRSRVDIEDTEEMRLLKLANEERHLKQIALCPVSGMPGRQPESIFMYHHLAWRMGHYIRYTLPVLLMTLDYNMAYAMRRQREILRHELGGLVSGSRDLVMQMDCNHGTVREDLRLMLRLVQRTLAATGMAGERVAINPPQQPIDVAHLFNVIKRNFPAKLRLITEQGYTGGCEIIYLGAGSLRAWIAEEDLYAVWRNLWNNARQALQDYSRESPSDGSRYKKQAGIIRECGTFTQRFQPDVPSTPTLLGILYDRQYNGDRWLFMDILDNAPQLKRSPMIYPDRVRAGHYGLRVVDDIVEQLASQGHRGAFEPIHVLAQDIAEFYKQFQPLQRYNWDEPSLWTRTSIKLQAEWD